MRAKRLEQERLEQFSCVNKVNAGFSASQFRYPCCYFNSDTHAYADTHAHSVDCTIHQPLQVRHQEQLSPPFFFVFFILVLVYLRPVLITNLQTETQNEYT